MKCKVISMGFMVCFLLAACEPSSLNQTARVTVVLQMEQLEDVSHIHITAHDVNMNKDYTDSTLSLTIPIGYYDWSISAENNGRPIRGYLRGVVISQDCSVTIQTDYMSTGEGDFVLAEIFFAGTETPEGKRYIGDKYFVIYNNSEDTLSADGLILMEADLNSVQKYKLDYDFRSEYFAVDALYRVPGTGTTYRVAPGKALLIADNAMNHKEANPNSFDLSEADLEWFDVSSSAGITDVDNPQVPNMDKLYCYTYTIWVPHNQGHKSFGLARFPEGMTAEKYFATDTYYLNYKYELVTSAGTFSQSKKSYVIPNEWIVDAVNLSPSETFQWLTFSQTLDAGYTYVAPTGSDVTRFGKAVRRKVQQIVNGRRVLQDTNNSTDDFEHGVPANPNYFK